MTDFKDPSESLTHIQTSTLTSTLKKKKSKGRTFSCTGYPGCNMSFTRSEHLARHIRKHTGERPFKCQHCNRRFSRLDNLRQHKQTVHVYENFIMTYPGDNVTVRVKNEDLNKVKLSLEKRKLNNNGNGMEGVSSDSDTSSNSSPTEPTYQMQQQQQQQQGQQGQQQQPQQGQHLNHMNPHMNHMNINHMNPHMSQVNANQFPQLNQYPPSSQQQSPITPITAMSSHLSPPNSNSPIQRQIANNKLPPPRSHLLHSLSDSNTNSNKYNQTINSSSSSSASSGSSSGSYPLRPHSHLNGTKPRPLLIPSSSNLNKSDLHLNLNLNLQSPNASNGSTSPFLITPKSAVSLPSPSPMPHHHHQLQLQQHHQHQVLQHPPHIVSQSISYTPSSTQSTTNPPSSSTSVSADNNNKYLPSPSMISFPNAYTRLDLPHPVQHHQYSPTLPSPMQMPPIRPSSSANNNGSTTPSSSYFQSHVYPPLASPSFSQTSSIQNAPVIPRSKSVEIPVASSTTPTTTTTFSPIPLALQTNPAISASAPGGTKNWLNNIMNERENKQLQNGTSNVAPVSTAEVDEDAKSATADLGSTNDLGGSKSKDITDNNTPSPATSLPLISPNAESFRVKLPALNDLGI